MNEFLGASSYALFIFPVIWIALLVDMRRLKYDVLKSKKNMTALCLLFIAMMISGYIANPFMRLFACEIMLFSVVYMSMQHQSVRAQEGSIKHLFFQMVSGGLGLFGFIFLVLAKENDLLSTSVPQECAVLMVLTSLLMRAGVFPFGTLHQDIDESHEDWLTLLGGLANKFVSLVMLIILVDLVSLQQWLTGLLIVLVLSSLYYAALFSVQTGVKRCLSYLAVYGFGLNLLFLLVLGVSDAGLQAVAITSLSIQSCCLAAIYLVCMNVRGYPRGSFLLEDFVGFSGKNRIWGVLYVVSYILIIALPVLIYLPYLNNFAQSAGGPSYGAVVVLLLSLVTVVSKIINIISITYQTQRVSMLSRLIVFRSGNKDKISAVTMLVLGVLTFLSAIALL